MRIECSYCKAHLGDKEPLLDPRTSHGICQACWETEVLPGILMDAIPGSIDPDTPVLIVSGEGRILGANDAAERIVGRVPRNLGLFGGDYLKCMFALDPGGCGETEACKTCTVRLAVQATLGGKTIEKLPVFLRQAGRHLKLTISTKEDCGMVRVTVHQVEVLGEEP